MTTSLEFWSEVILELTSDVLRVALDLAEVLALYGRHEGDANHERERIPLPAPLRQQEVVVAGVEYVHAARSHRWPTFRVAGSRTLRPAEYRSRPTTSAECHDRRGASASSSAGCAGLHSQDLAQPSTRQFTDEREPARAHGHPSVYDVVVNSVRYREDGHRDDWMIGALPQAPSATNAFTQAH